MGAPLRYRFAHDDEIDDIARLVSHSFPGAARDAAFWRVSLGTPLYGGGADTLFIGEDADRVVAALQLHPLRQWIGGAKLPCAGIGTVAIAPTHRRRRLGARLMTAALHAAKARGDVVSSLYPFRMSFYAQLGYGQADVAHQYQVAPAQFADSPERAHVELLDTERASRDALAFYNAWARTQTGQLERGERLWTHLTTRHDRALVGYRAANRAITGYALVTYHADAPDGQRFLDVDELVWTTPESRRGLYGWLASLGDQWQQLVVRALPAHQLGEWIREPRLPRGQVPAWNLWAPAGALMMGTMFRILDLPAAWQQRSTVAGESFAIDIDVHDAQIPANGGRWRLGVEDGRATAERSNAPSADLHVDIATLSRLYIGALTASAAYDAGLLAATRAEDLRALDMALAVPQPWTWDRF